MADTEIGYYTLPVILSFDGIEKNVNSKLGKAFGDVGKKSSKAFADSTEADLKRATDAYGKLRDRAADALGKVRVEEEKLKKARDGGKADQIAAAEERLSKARRDSTRINKEAAASHDSLIDAQRRLGSSSRNTGGSLGGMKDAVGGLVAKMGGVAGIAAGAAAAIGVVGAAAIAGAKELYDLGARFDDVSDKLAIRTGATGANLQALNDTIKGLAPVTASSISTIGDVVGSVSHGLGLTGEQLATVSKNILDLNRLTGQDINVRELGKAFRAFGVDAQDQVGTLDQLLQASQKTGLDINSLIGTVTKAGPALREFGLDFGQSAALVGTFEQAGLDADTALGGLRVALKNVAKDGKDPRTAIQGTVTDIKALIDAGREADAITLAGSVFGKSYLPFFDAIKRGDLDVETLNKTLADNGQTIQGLAGNTEDWSEKWQKVKNSVETAISPTAGVFFDTINASLGDLGTWVINNQDAVIGFFVGLGNAAITAAEFVIDAVGQVARGIGEVIAPIGDIQGAMLKFQAFQADIRGDTETANELRKQAEEMFGLGEGLIKFADKAESFKADNLRNALNDAGEKAKAAAEETSNFGAEVDKLDGKTVNVAIGVSADRQKLNDIFSQFTTLANPSGIGGAPGRTGSEQGLTQTSVGAKRAIEAAFPLIDTIGGYRPDPAYPNEHPAGKALDVMIPKWNTPSGKSYGDQVAKYLLDNASALGIDYILWQQRQWNADGTSSPMRDLGSANLNHLDHVHVHTEGSAQLPGAKPPAKPTLSTSLPGASAMPAMSSVPGLSSAIDTSGLTAGSQALTNAYGAGFEPGIGTPGRNEYGEAGYFRTDEKALREAKQRADDAAYAIIEADAAAEQARAARDALDPSIGSDASQIAGADDAVRDAERRAALARREAADAATDAAEVAKGEFTKAKEVAKTKDPKTKAAGQDSPLGALGSIASSFLEETFGFGSLLPALDSFAPLQMADTLIGAFDWSTMGMSPEAQAAKAAAQGTSSDAFGIPNIAAPPMPQGGAHGGSGAAPGPTIVNVDQSQNFSNSPLGWDPAQVNKQRENNINRAPRLPIGMGN
jgi:TP901 family phage tail tape measure protein